MLIKESANLRKNRKWRIVDHHAAFRVVLVLIITARVKRAEDLSVTQFIMRYSPILDGVINDLRSKTIIRCFLGLKLIGKRLVFLGAFALLVAPEVLTFRLRSFSGSSPGVGIHRDGFHALRVKTGDSGVKV